jgi:hypothetical protein
MSRVNATVRWHGYARHINLFVSFYAIPKLKLVGQA